MDQLEHPEGLFLDSASTLFFRDCASRSGELLEDNSSSAAVSLSSNRIGSLPLFYLTGGDGGFSLVHSRPVHPLGEFVGGRFPPVDDQHNFAIRPSVWSVPPALPTYPGTSEGIDLRGTDSLGCWS